MQVDQQLEEEKKTLEQNRIIGDFIGHSPAPAYHIERHWRELMAVIERIESLAIETSDKYLQDGYTVYMYGCHCSISSVIIRQGKRLYDRHHRGKDKLEAVHRAVVAFIEWYNNNQLNK